MTDTQPTPDPTAGPSASDQPPTFETPQAPDPDWTVPAVGSAQPSPAPAPPRSAPRRRGGEVLLVIVGIFAVGAIGFAVGRSTAPTRVAQVGIRGSVQAPNGGQLPNGRQFPNGGQLPNGRQLPDNRQLPNGQGGLGGNGRMGLGQGGLGQGGLGAGGLGITLSGQVTEITADHITLKLASGQTIQVALNGTTTYHTQAAATAADVTTGSTVQVQVTRGELGNGGGNGNGGTVRLGQATSVTIVPK